MTLETKMRIAALGLAVGLTPFLSRTVDEAQRINYQYKEEKRIADVEKDLMNIKGYEIATDQKVNERFNALRKDYQTSMSNPSFRTSYAQYQKDVEHRDRYILLMPLIYIGFHIAALGKNAGMRRL